MSGVENYREKEIVNRKWTEKQDSIIHIWLIIYTDQIKIRTTSNIFFSPYIVTKVSTFMIILQALMRKIGMHYKSVLYQ